jgi:uncharacterized protein
MIRSLVALAAGILFGLGLAISQMVNPAKVLAFLDIGAAAPGLAGAWDPSLALVMGGALAVTMLGYRLALRRPEPVLGGAFQLPQATHIDRRLVGGAAIFGVGWGLVGFCPGPAIASLAFGLHQSFIFVAAMLAGAWLFHFRARREAAGASQRA